MPTPKEFNLLVVHGDGRRVVRLALSRWVILIALGVLLAAPIALAVIYGDYLELRRERASLAQLTARVTEQQTLIESSQARMRELRAEIDSWRDLQARIWEPFGPEDGKAKRGSAMGGPTGPARSGEGPDRGAIGDELERLTSLVKDDGEQPRPLERFLVRARPVRAALPARWPRRGPPHAGLGARLT